MILVSFFGVETSRLKALSSFNIRMPQHQSISEYRKTHLREWLRSDLTDDTCIIDYFQVSQVFKEYCTWDVFCLISKVLKGCQFFAQCILCQIIKVYTISSEPPPGKFDQLSCKTVLTWRNKCLKFCPHYGQHFSNSPKNAPPLCCWYVWNPLLGKASAHFVGPEIIEQVLIM